METRDTANAEAFSHSKVHRENLALSDAEIIAVDGVYKSGLDFDFETPRLKLAYHCTHWFSLQARYVCQRVAKAHS